MMDELERENAALREQLAGRTEQLEVSIQNNALIKNGLLKRAERAEAELAKLRQMVAQQAEDEGLWFNAATAPEAYLQQELRRLHAAVEGTK